MPKAHKLNMSTDLSNYGNETASEIFDWAMRNDCVADSKLISMSEGLTFSKMNPSRDVAPNLFLIGREAISRKIFGDEWADDIHKTHNNPIPSLPSATAEGYLEALDAGYHFDLVEFQDERYVGSYNRLILPIRTKRNHNPMYFVTLQILNEFDKIH